CAAAPSTRLVRGSARGSPSRERDDLSALERTLRSERDPQALGARARVDDRLLVAGEAREKVPKLVEEQLVPFEPGERRDVLGSVRPSDDERAGDLIPSRRAVLADHLV